MSTSRRVRVICRPASKAGFALAGLEVDVATDAATATAALKHHAADPKVGVVLVDGPLYQLLPSDLTQKLDRQAQPIVAPFPEASWDEAAAAEEYVLKLLRQAIGYRVKPR